MNDPDISEDIELFLKAQRFAIEAHGDQKYGDQPYVLHLGAVIEALRVFKVTDLRILAVGWLHDTIEDTDVTYDDVHREFGQFIANLVDLVSDGEGRNRKERHANTYPMIGLNPDATIVKLADRSANMTYGIFTKNISKLKMYIKEYPDFKQMIMKPEVHELAWWQLDYIVEKAVELVKLEQVQG